MLSELRVSQFAIIDRINVHFQPGLNVLSGETGSGKSVLLKSLALLMGDKSVSDAIKTGAPQATVEGLFDLSRRTDIKNRLIASGISTEENAKDVDDLLVVKRIISTDGKNRVYINGSLSTLQQLREIVAPLIEVTGAPAPLIEMTGQHDNRHLQSKSFHLEALDQYVGATPLRKQLSGKYDEYNQVRAQLQELEQSLRSRSQRLDFLTFQRDEIKNLDLKEGEELDLENQLHIMKNSAKFTEFVAAAESALYSEDESALVRIHRVLQRGLDLGSLNDNFAKKLEPLQQAKTLIEEAVYELRDFAQNLSVDPAQKEHLESKMSQWRKLQNKYGTGVREILDALANMEKEIHQLENSEESLEQMRAQLKSMEEQMQKWAKDLHKQRVGGAATLAKSMNAQLSELNMKGLIFGVQIHLLPELTANGISDVEFVIQGSKKDSARSLAKYASGGELSRILLSLKCTVGASEHPRTYLFDEVDAGVSGVTAEKVGRKLKSISAGQKGKPQQVICITHLPQVAAFADAHYVIHKTSGKDTVKMSVQELKSDEQVQEIARMLSGEKITKASIENARELLRGN